MSIVHWRIKYYRPWIILFCTVEIICKERLSILVTNWDLQPGEDGQLLYLRRVWTSGFTNAGLNNFGLFWGNLGILNGATICRVCDISYTNYFWSISYPDYIYNIQKTYEKIQFRNTNKTNKIEIQIKIKIIKPLYI